MTSEYVQWFKQVNGLSTNVTDDRETDRTMKKCVEIGRIA